MPLEAFDARAPEYDAWYDSQAGATIFAMEVDCLRPLLQRHKRPFLEIGVGSGRFARALGIEYGLDPSPALLGIAASRGIQPIRAVGEMLPFPDNTFGGVMIAFTLCFAQEPATVLEEAWRVLQPGGGLALGLIPGSSPWAGFYASKGRQGHPLYQGACFFDIEQVEGWLRLAGFEQFDHRSTLFQKPGQDFYQPEGFVAGYHRPAGFVVIGGRKPGAESAARNPGKPILS